MATNNSRSKKADSGEHTIDELVDIMVKTAEEVHAELGHGKPIDVYGRGMESRLKTKGCSVKKQVKESVITIGDNSIEYIVICMLVNDLLPVNAVVVDRLAPVFKEKMSNYLVVTGHRLGLIINFNEPNIDDGITRVIN